MIALIAAAVIGQQSPYAPLTGTAPELVGSQWLNVDPARPMPTLAARRGFPTLVAYWTFACHNCQANYAAYDRIYAAFKPKGVELFAVHTPEIPIERDPKKVEAHIKEKGMKYPVLIDNSGENWQRWKQSVWPTIYAIDKKGRVRRAWVGELAWKGKRGEEELANYLRVLLAE
ncbi:MAG: redoxin domain-containing protein [Fimbriimonadaceae bacterium]|nr:redoxin domain-containing protein [Fimbriimonadaceae bacterium]